MVLFKWCYLLFWYVVCSSSTMQRRKIVLGHSLKPGYLQVHCPTASWELRRLYCTARTRTTRVCVTGLSPLCFYFARNTVQSKVNRGAYLILPPLSNDTLIEQDGRTEQRRGIHDDGHESRSPDSACSLGYDSRTSSPDHVLEGEDLMWWSIFLSPGSLGSAGVSLSRHRAKAG